MNEENYKMKYLKSADEYIKEMIDIFEDLIIGMASDTLTNDDEKTIMARMNEILIILEWINSYNKNN